MWSVHRAVHGGLNSAWARSVLLYPIVSPTDGVVSPLGMLITRVKKS